MLKWGRGDDVGEVFAAMTSHDVVVESACSRAPARPFILSGIRPVLCFGGLGRRERSKIWRERSSFNKDFGGKELLAFGGKGQIAGEGKIRWASPTFLAS